MAGSYCTTQPDSPSATHRLPAHGTKAIRARKKTHGAFAHHGWILFVLTHVAFLLILISLDMTVSLWLSLILLMDHSNFHVLRKSVGHINHAHAHVGFKCGGERESKGAHRRSQWSCRQESPRLPPLQTITHNYFLECLHTSVHLIALKRRNLRFISMHVCIQMHRKRGEDMHKLPPVALRNLLQLWKVLLAHATCAEYYLSTFHDRVCITVRQRGFY